MSDDAASILYPDAAPQPAPKSGDVADRLYPNEDAISNPPLDRHGYRLKPGEKDTSPDAPKPKPKAKPEPTPKSPEHVARVAEIIARDLDLDPQHELTGEFSKTAAELGLSTDQTKKLTDMHNKVGETFWTKTWNGWRTEAEKLPQDDIDGARQFVKSYGDSELTALLDDYGLGNHPALIRAMARAAKGTSK